MRERTERWPLASGDKEINMDGIQLQWVRPGQGMTFSGEDIVVIDPKPLTIDERRETSATVELKDGVNLSLNPFDFGS